MSKLVAYFSASGKTASLAQKLADEAGADIFEIRPAVPYTSEDLNWMNKQSRSSVEMSDKSSRPAIADTSVDISKYEQQDKTPAETTTEIIATHTLVVVLDEKAETEQQGKYCIGFSTEGKEKPVPYSTVGKS